MIRCTQQLIDALERVLNSFPICLGTNISGLLWVSEGLLSGELCPLTYAFGLISGFGFGTIPYVLK